MLKRLLQKWTTQLPVCWRPFADFDGAAGGEVLTEEPGQSFPISEIRFHGPAVPIESPRNTATEPTRRLFSLRDAGVYGDSGAVYGLSARAFVEETLDNWYDRAHWEKTFAAPRFPPATLLSGCTFLASTLGGQSFYHFLFDALPKLLWGKEQLQQCDRILLNDGCEETKLRWLRLLDIRQPVVFQNGISHFHCEHLLFTGRCVAHFTPNPWVIHLLRNAVESRAAATTGTGSPGQMLWLDRRGASARQLDWEDCRDARLLAGFHGAAFANLLFCRPGVRSIELCFGKIYQPWYARLAEQVGADHHVVMLNNRDDPKAAAHAVLRELLP